MLKLPAQWWNVPKNVKSEVIIGFLGRWFQISNWIFDLTPIGDPKFIREMGKISCCSLIKLSIKKMVSKSLIPEMLSGFWWRPNLGLLAYFNWDFEILKLSEAQYEVGLEMWYRFRSQWPKNPIPIIGYIFIYLFIFFFNNQFSLFYE